MDAEHARALGRLKSDRERWERYVGTVQERLRMDRERAIQWIEDMYEGNDRELAEAVALGALIEGGQVFWPDEVPRSLEGRTTD